MPARCKVAGLPCRALSCVLSRRIVSHHCPRRPSTVRARKANTMRAGSVDAMTARRADASGLSRRRRGVGLEPLGEQVEQTVDGRISPSTSPWSC